MGVPENYVYLDYAATAPLCEEAAQAMAPYLLPGRANLVCGGNANSLHSPGRAAFAEMERARRSIAADLGAARPDEIVFTSGATEADDAAMFGLAQGIVDARARKGDASFTPQIVVSAIEHDAVLAPAKRLESRGFEIVRVRPNRRGFIEAEAVADVLTDRTVLVSVQMANSEVGSVQPIAAIAAAAHRAGALMHTDAVQALGKTPVDVRALGVDAASFSAHKVGGPKGVGALYLAARTPFVPYQLGGGQESGRRSGTQNVAGIVGFAAACHAACAGVDAESARLRALRDQLYDALSNRSKIEATVDVQVGDESYLPNIVHVLVDGLESETLILRLDMLGFGVSGGSACSSHSLEPSHVLRAIGIDGDRAAGALRISMGRYTTQTDIDGFIAAVDSCLDWN